MSSRPVRSLTDPLPRRDIVAICVYLNRTSVPKSVDASIRKSSVYLDKLTAAARMQ
jgi:hypothetical protein